MLSGCADDSGAEPEGTTGQPAASAGTEGTEGAEGTEGTEGTEGSDGADGSESGLADVCEPFVSDPPSPGTTSIVVRNETAAPIFVGDTAACELIAFSLESAGDAYRYKADPCRTTCAEAIAEACNSGCGACGSFSVVRLAPGAQWEYTWNRLGHGLVTLPSECAAGPCSMCEQPQDLAESVTLRAQAHTSCIEDNCECGTDACELEIGSHPDDAPLTVEFEFDPTDAEVVVVFE